MLLKVTNCNQIKFRPSGERHPLENRFSSTFTRTSRRLEDLRFPRHPMMLKSLQRNHHRFVVHLHPRQANQEPEARNSGLELALDGAQFAVPPASDREYHLLISCSDTRL